MKLPVCTLLLSLAVVALLCGCHPDGAPEKNDTACSSTQTTAAYDDFNQLGYPNMTESAYLDRIPTDIAISATDEGQRILANAVKMYQMKLAVIANNLANAETVAFKRCDVVIEDMPYRSEPLSNYDRAGETPSHTSLSIGSGARVTTVDTDFSQGTLLVTGRSLDLAIEGMGFFQVVDDGGEILYTRAGQLSVNANSALVIGSGKHAHLIEPAIDFPPDATGIEISRDGRVSVMQPGSSDLTEVGQLELAVFSNPQGLLRKGDNLYAETDLSSSPTTGIPGQINIGLLHRGTLEASNVDMRQERQQWLRTLGRLELILELIEEGSAR